MTSTSSPSSNDSHFFLKSPSSSHTYTILQRLDRGAFSVVWLAERSHEDARFAIKIQGTDSFETPTYAELPLRARRELSILETTHHPNIIRLHEHFIFQESFIQILDFFPMNLDTFIKEQQHNPGSLTLTRVRYILFQIANGLSVLHGKEIVHRDMKPHNLVINPEENDHVCLIDFGCARSVSECSSSSSSGSLPDKAGVEGAEEKSLTPQVVTRPYRSPELLLGERKYTCAIDMWALGCTMYELLMGQTFVCENVDWKQLVGLFDKLGGPFDLDGVGQFDFFQFQKQDGLHKDELFSGMELGGSDEEWRGLMVLWDGLMTQNYVRRITAGDALQLDVFNDFV